MRAVFVMFDSLNRRALGAYGGSAVPTPNFDRLAKRAVTFDNHFVGSMPCMPARRDLMTGRLNFLHRSWGPLEPFDNAFPVLLREGGVYSHLVTDHYHYFEDGGWTFHQRFDSWEYMRGQEADKWRPVVAPDEDALRSQFHPLQYETDRHGFRRQGMINRAWIQDEKDFPCVKSFERAIAFLDANRDADDWFLQLETFDPHEPFHAPKRFRERHRTNYAGPILDWPRYRRIEESPDEVAELRANYAALLAMCDEYLGKLLDYFDANDLWKDTALIVSTDHGFMLGEHDWWGKNRMPFYDEIARIPLFVHHPLFAPQAGTRRQGLTQTMDLMPTILEMFGQPIPKEVRGRSLLPLLVEDGPGHDAVAYGIFGGATNVTDGRFTYFRYPPDLSAQEIYEYTLMPVHMHSFFEPAEFEGAMLVDGFDFTKGVPVMRLPARRDAKRPPSQGGGIEDAVTVLYDTASDPGQSKPVENADVVARLTAAITTILDRHDAPPEAYERIGLETPVARAGAAT